MSPSWLHDPESLGLTVHTVSAALAAPLDVKNESTATKKMESIAELARMRTTASGLQARERRAKLLNTTMTPERSVAEVTIFKI